MFHVITVSPVLLVHKGVGSIRVCCVANRAESVRDVMLLVQINIRVVYHLTDDTDLKIQIL
jgi:hypothetical protein